jgi:anti-anti-sigma factor
VSIETHVHQSGPVSVLAVSGKLVSGEPSTSFRSAVEEILKAGNQRIVLNFAEVSYADSAGIGALAVNFSTVKSAGGAMAMVQPQERVREVMEITRLTQLIPIFETEQEAVRSFDYLPEEPNPPSPRMDSLSSPSSHSIAS